MAEIVLDRVTKSYPDGATAVKDLSMTHRRRRVHHPRRPVRLRKVHHAEHDCGPGGDLVGRAAHRRGAGERKGAQGPRYRDGVPVLRALPAHDRPQNIAFPLTLAKVKKAEIASKVEETARILDLTELLDRKPAQLSGGQRQRVAMGRAIVRDPKAFLMDEPLSNLDAKLRVQMRSEIAHLQLAGHHHGLRDAATRPRR